MRIIIDYGDLIVKTIDNVRGIAPENDDDTELVIRGQGWKRRGNWYEDHMLKTVSEYGESVVREVHLHDYLDIGRNVEIIIRDF